MQVATATTSRCTYRWSNPRSRGPQKYPQDLAIPDGKISLYNREGRTPVILVLILRTAVADAGIGWQRFAIPLGRQAAGGNTQLDQIIDSRLRTPLAELLIISVTTPAIGMAGKLNANLRIAGQQL